MKITSTAKIPMIDAHWTPKNTRHHLTHKQHHRPYKLYQVKFKSKRCRIYIKNK